MTNETGALEFPIYYRFSSNSAYKIISAAEYIKVNTYKFSTGVEHNVEPGGGGVSSAFNIYIKQAGQVITEQEFKAMCDEAMDKTHKAVYGVTISETQFGQTPTMSEADHDAMIHEMRGF